MKPAFQTAVKNALSTYAELAGITVPEATEQYIKNGSTQETIALLVFVQADPEKLRAMAPTLRK